MGAIASDTRGRHRTNAKEATNTDPPGTTRGASPGPQPIRRERERESRGEAGGISHRRRLPLPSSRRQQSSCSAGRCRRTHSHPVTGTKPLTLSAEIRVDAIAASAAMSHISSRRGKKDDESKAGAAPLGPGHSSMFLYHLYPPRDPVTVTAVFAYV